MTSNIQRRNVTEDIKDCSKFLWSDLFKGWTLQQEEKAEIV